MKNRANNFVTLFLSRIAGVRKNKNQDGTAMVIALLIMILLMGFVALAISRTTSETVSSANDAYESRAFDAAHASLEIMTRNFNKIFEVKLNANAADETRIESQVPPVFDLDYNFNQIITQTDATRSVILTEGQFQGLTALRDGWRLDTTATDLRNGVQVALHRNFFNNRIPIFQFGIFYDDDLEFHPGPRFDFGGRVHSNGSLFLAAGTRLNFSSKVTAKDFIFSDVQKNGQPASNWGENVYIRNASGNFVQLRYPMGSVLQNPVNGAPVVTNPAPDIPLPTAYNSAAWGTNEGLFGGNLLAGQKALNLPLKLNSDIAGLNLGLIELIKRGKAVGDLWNDGVGTVLGGDLIVPVTAADRDDNVTSGERYYNKTGIRIHLADSKAKLPGCWDSVAIAVVAGPCGIRLDGEITGRLRETDPGFAAANVALNGRGYQPRAMTGGYQATRINGERFFIPGREAWIKIETVIYNAATLSYDTVDVTEDILSLGVTEAAIDITTGPAAQRFTVTEANYNATLRDSRSIIKLQRFMFGGSAVPRFSTAVGTSYLFNAPFGAGAGVIQNFVRPGNVPAAQDCKALPLPVRINGGVYGGFAGDNQAHWLNAEIGNPAGATRECIAPFPINMFDTREGLFNDTTGVFNPTAAGNYGSGPWPGPTTQRVPWAGVMSMVDIDVANLRRFLNGNFDGQMPNGTPASVFYTRAMISTDVPQPDNVIPKSGGWVFYVSDRRGDWDFDGEYDMEDVYGPNDGILQPGEDFQKNALQIGFGTLQTDYINEAIRYRGNPANPCLAEGTCIYTDIAAVFEHRYYRRGVRLINGQTLPGAYDPVTPTNTSGFTVASENAVYVQGNYNATGIVGVGVPTPHTDFLPLSTSAGNVPASIAADAVVILSNNWRDANSFSSPFSFASRTATETHIRFAMLTGDTQSSLDGIPNQGGGDPRMSGGVHNFKRFLENWGGQRLNYSGSLINLFNSHNNNGPFKCCTHVYSPPDRNWVFDATFLDINRIPPGTPFFQSLQITGFQRQNN